MELLHELYKQRKIVDADNQMKIVNEVPGALELSVANTEIYAQIRNLFCLLEKFREAMHARAKWQVVYESVSPYESGGVSNVECRRNTAVCSDEVLMSLTLQAPMKYAIFLAWGVEFMHVWCESVKCAYLLCELDSMSRLVLIEMKPNWTTLYTRRALLVRMTLLEHETGGGTRITILMENMPAAEQEKYKSASAGMAVLEIKSLFISFHQFSQLNFDVEVYYARCLKNRNIAYLQDYGLAYTIVGSLWKLASSARNAGIMGRDCVCFGDWTLHNHVFCTELDKKLVRARL